VTAKERILAIKLMEKQDLNIERANQIGMHVRIVERTPQKVEIRKIYKEVKDMSKFTKWAKKHKGAIAAGAAAVAGILIWGLLPEKEKPAKKTWTPPVKKNWYMESDD